MKRIEQTGKARVITIEPFQIEIQTHGEKEAGMQNSDGTPQDELLESVKEFLDALSARVEQPETCSVCGGVINYVQCVFEICGTPSKWTVRLPVCLCEDPERLQSEQ